MPIRLFVTPKPPLPICGGSGKLVGMISLGDLNAFNVSQQEAQILFLNDYIYGRA